jgi:hypothetical protein
MYTIKNLRVKSERTRWRRKECTTYGKTSERVRNKGRKRKGVYLKKSRSDKNMIGRLKNENSTLEERSL